MFTTILVAHVLIAIVLVIVVLLQSGKGGGLGAGFGGGGANTLFGSSGGSNFFTKLTMSLAAAFMVTSLSLTMIRSKALKSSIFDQGAPNTSVPATPANPANTAVPVTAPPSPNSTSGTPAVEPAAKAISPGQAPAAAPKK
ncbi:MAG: preprotein translocase subunit SecG [Bdellovibrionota bacterium]